MKRIGIINLDFVRGKFCCLPFADKFVEACCIDANGLSKWKVNSKKRKSNRRNLIYIYTFSGEKYITNYTTLDEIEELLNPKDFYRANRQSIIHIDSIQSIKPLENQKLIVQLKGPLSKTEDISREKAPSFKKWWEL